MFQLAHTALIYILPFLAVLTLVITVHEFGHFIVARMCGVAVDRFSIGFGRALVSWKGKGGMQWRIGWMPLGGYVRFAGDESVASVPDAEDLAELRRQVLAREGPAALRRYFHFKPLWQRALVVLAGPAANFVLAIVIFSALAMAFGDVVTTPKVGAVVGGSPAAQAGFVAGDVIRSADGHRIDSFEDLSRFVVMRRAEPIRFVVQRAGRPVTIVATPGQRVEGAGGGQKMVVGYLGILSSRDPADTRMVRYGPVAAVGRGVQQTWQILGTTITYLRRIAAGYETGDQLSGPLGIAQATGGVASEVAQSTHDIGVLLPRLAIAMAGMAALISVAVGFANLLPIPVLDGGHLLFYAYEAVARRPLAASVQAAGYRVGFALLIGLMLFVTWNDLQRFRVFHLIGGLFS
jgi:regulator of sigma E protease